MSAQSSTSETRPVAWPHARTWRGRSCVATSPTFDIVQSTDATRLSKLSAVPPEIPTVVTPGLERVSLARRGLIASEEYCGWGMGRRTMQPCVSLRAKVPATLAVAGTIAGTVACATLAVPASAAASGAPPATRSYSGRVAAGTGAYSKVSAQMTVSLGLAKTGEAQAPDPQQKPLPRYTVTITFHGSRCAAKPPRRIKCLVLSGALKGEAEEERPSPPVSDQPERIRVIACSGELTHLGAVTATGSLEGTGFAPTGRRSLLLKIATKHGKLVVKATGPPVPAFTPA
jgi:hypothetical protein